MAEITQNIIYYMTGGRAHSTREISFADINGGVFERHVAGVEKAWY